MFQSSDIVLDSLHCGKFKTNSLSYHDLDLDLTMPKVQLVRGIFISYDIYLNFKILDTLYYELSCLYTHTHIHTKTDRQLDCSTL